MDQRERGASDLEVILTALDGRQAELWTLLPGIIESFDAVAMTAVVQPSVQIPYRDKTGAVTMLTMPLLLDCPVEFPGGGGVTLTFPVAKGDECTVKFASRCIDGWWQSGGIQPPPEWRMHDLSDGFVFVGVRSQARVLSDVSTSAVELRSDDGVTKIALDPSAQTVSITAPGGVTITGDLHVTGTITGDTDVKTGAISLKTHHHTGVQTGSGNTGGPA